MRTGLHRLSFIIRHGAHSHLDIASVRFHNLNGLTDRELITLLKAVHSGSILLSYDAQIRIALLVRIVIVDLCLFRRLCQHKSL